MLQPGLPVTFIELQDQISLAQSSTMSRSYRDYFSLNLGSQGHGARGFRSTVKHYFQDDTLDLGNPNAHLLN